MRWSLLVECMWWVSCWPCTNSAYVCVATCVIKLERVIGVRCVQMQYIWWCCNLIYFAVQIHYLLSCWSWLDEKGVRLHCFVLEFDTCYCCSMQYEVVISPSSCAVQIHHDDGSALICVGWIYGTYWCSKRYGVVNNLTYHVLCAIQIHYNGDDGSDSLAFVGWMYGMGVVLALYEQRVRLYSCVCGWI